VGLYKILDVLRSKGFLIKSLMIAIYYSSTSWLVKKYKLQSSINSTYANESWAPVVVVGGFDSFAKVNLPLLAISFEPVTIADSLKTNALYTPLS